jgi:YidC/Oxa1 family membrane protein insertase
LSERRNNRQRWAWLLGLAAVMSLSGCSLYPAKPGEWPQGFWGDVLKAVSAVIDYFAHLIPGPYRYGISLLIVTILVRLLILPLMMKQLRMQRAMQELQPEIANIRAKYQGDNQKIQEELMKLYQRAGVNPFAGCLPILIQLPILWALFGAIEGNMALNQSSFLWIRQLGAPDHLYILPIVAALTTYLSQRIVMTATDPQTRIMLYTMPFFVFLFASRFAAGLALYWIYGNLFTAVQSYFLRIRPAPAAQAAGEAPARKPAKASPSGQAEKPSKRGS